MKGSCDPKGIVTHRMRNTALYHLGSRDWTQVGKAWHQVSLSTELHRSEKFDSIKQFFVVVGVGGFLRQGLTMYPGTLYRSACLCSKVLGLKVCATTPG